MPLDTTPTSAPTTEAGACSTVKANNACNVAAAPNVDFELGITPAAAVRLKEICTTGQFLRVYVYEGGCSGLKTGFELDTQNHAGDAQFSDGEGATVVSDADSLEYINGSVVDYVDNGLSARFVLINPKATGGCGCGNSFKVQ